MRTPIAEPSALSKRDLSPPPVFLNCYRIANPEELIWPVRIYDVIPLESTPPTHEGRGTAKDAIWKLYFKHKTSCRGYGAPVDINKQQIAVPDGWDLPSGEIVNGLRVDFRRRFETSPFDRESQPIIAGILRESIKSVLKKSDSRQLGRLWQDFNRFCQMPADISDRQFLFCRKFGVSAKVLRGKRWVLQMLISTVTLDGRTLADYYRSGDIDELREMVSMKQENRLNRNNRPPSVRVFQHSPEKDRKGGRVIDVHDPEAIGRHSKLSKLERDHMANGTIMCQAFNQPPVPVPLCDVRLVLDTQITKSDHIETIIDPDERYRLSQDLRNVLDGFNAVGKTIRLDSVPVSASEFPAVAIPFPALRIGDRTRGERILKTANRATPSSLKQRGRKLLEGIRTGGFLQSRPINPLIACPKSFGAERTTRLQEDLNKLLRSTGTDYSFSTYQYDTIDNLRRHIETHGFDALLAVLPEGSRTPQVDGNTHELIKQRIEVPSQCIQHDHTLPPKWVRHEPHVFKEKEARLARRIDQQYQLCVWNLLVKHHWIPFAPVDPFHYNVHIGLDVGGRHNNRVMSCLGYGFAEPSRGLLFRPEEIPIDVQQAEPIPTRCLHLGLLRMMEETHQDLRETGVVPNFERVLFFRDGMLLGDGDRWNEMDALQLLHKELQRRGWVSNAAIWTVVELMKNAEEWRMIRNENGISNPLSGDCLLPFENEDSGLICTTGLPYLTQGTASPLKFNIKNVTGKANRHEVLRDLAWEADMCFTKPDTGMSMPWVLHVADTGALQLAKSYKITGITS